jgi:anti-anti-sigma regulatory factor
MPTTYQMLDVHTNMAGFHVLANLHQCCIQSSDQEIALDFRNVSWFDANMAAPLGAIHHLLQTQHQKRLKLQNVRPRVGEILLANGLFVSKTRAVPAKKTVIPFKRFEAFEAVPFAEYTQRHFQNKGMPKMSTALEKGFFEGIDELFQNASLHSKTKHGVFACGQQFPIQHRLDFSLVDLGLGFQEVIRRGVGKDMPSSEAIEWAMSGRNTTRTGDVPGGLGLKILKNFVRLNGGKLSVVSQGGAWSMDSSGVQRSTLSVPFPGTVITLEVDTSDDAAYSTPADLDPSAVF